MPSLREIIWRRDSRRAAKSLEAMIYAKPGEIAPARLPGIRSGK